MTATIRQQLEQCTEAFQHGQLTELHWHQVIASLDHIKPKPQDFLYLQTSSSRLVSRVNGMRLLVNGELSDGPANPDEWPYQTVLEAIKDGWRVIQFPNLALLVDDSRTYALGCEFILER
jgi:hypothetical protein